MRSWHHGRSYEVGRFGLVVERSDSIAVVGWKDLSMVERTGVLYYIAVAVVSEACSRVGRSM